MRRVGGSARRDRLSARDNRPDSRLSGLNIHNRRAQDVSPCSFYDNNIPPIKPTALCPVKLVCNYDANRYPSLILEKVCTDCLGQFKTFQCANATFQINVLKREACIWDRVALGWRWAWTTETIKTGCRVTNAQHRFHNLKALLTAKTPSDEANSNESWTIGYD
jgi:hypothetical protein